MELTLDGSERNTSENRFVDEYKSLTSWNYRPPAMSVHVPALVRHLGYWIAGASVELTSDKRRELFRDLAYSIVSNNIDRGFRLENPPSQDTDAERRFLTFCIDGGRWREMPLKLVIELHNEFVTISATLELKLDEPLPDTYRGIRDSVLGGDPNSPSFSDGPLPTSPVGAPDVQEGGIRLPGLQSSIKTMEALVATRFNSLAFESQQPAPTRKSCDDMRTLLAGPYQDIFATVWEEFDKEILKRAVKEVLDKSLIELREADDLKAADGKKPSDLGKIFADFRGFLLPYARLGRAINDLAGTSARPLLQFDDRAGVPPQDHSEIESEELSSNSVALARSILPFMTPEPEYQVKKELTVSLLLQRRCLYASTLGAQPPAPDSNSQPDQPLTYFLMPVSLNSWQIGRVVDRLHRLGAVRLATCRHLSSLRHARHELKALEDHLLKIELSSPHGTQQDHDRRSDNLQRIATDLQQCFIKLTEIKQSVPGGLGYRVERARYYRNQFISLIKPLRVEHCGRIEGFQPYYEFVYGRFGDTFEFIDMLGKRLVRVDQQLRAKNDEVRTAELDRIRKETGKQTGVISDLVKEIASLQQTSAKTQAASTEIQAASVNIQQTTKKQLTKIKDLQMIGELALFLVIAPYYVSQILFHIVSPFPKPFEERQVHFITTCIALLGGGFCLVLEKDRRHKNAVAAKNQAKSPGAEPGGSNSSSTSQGVAVLN